MQPLNFPSFQFSLSKTKKGLFIFDVLRKKKLLLTPEEWVRQHLVHFLIEYRNFPALLMQSEASLRVGELNKRCDLLIYNKQQQPLLLAECKRASHKLSQTDLDQISRYNTTFNVPYLILTNGLEHFFIYFDREEKVYKILNDIPTWEDLC